MKKITAVAALILSAALLLSACASKDGDNNTISALTSSGEKVSDDSAAENMDFTFSDSDRDGSYDEASATVVSDDSDTVEIQNAGTYIISGTHRTINVNAADTEKIQIVLKNAEISNDSGPAVLISSADKVFITVPENSESSLSDGTSYSSDYADTNIDGSVFSKADLTLNGEGILNINGNYKCGAVSKDDLVIYGLTLNITSVGVALEGKDCVKCAETVISVNAGGDGIKSTNTEDTSRGYVYIESGSYDITAENDGLQAETVIKTNGGEFKIHTGGGSENSSSASDRWGMWGGTANTSSENSAKGVKASQLILINGGSFSIDSSDDSIHSNGSTEINGGSITLSSGDDGIHSDDRLIINGGSIKAEKTYEGLEGQSVTITGGEIDITSSDDGINSAGGNDSSSLEGRPGANTFATDSDAFIEISGGYTLIDADGDGLDSNGSITVAGGLLLVSGPSNSGNGGLDYASEALINGGVAIICSSAGMAQGFSDNSEQCSFMYTLDKTADSGSFAAVSSSDGTVIASFLPSKQYGSVVVSSPQLKSGESYTLSIGGTVSGCDKNGFAEDGEISDADESYEIEMTSGSVVYGASGGMGGGMNGGFNGGAGGERPAEPIHR